jgi:hypothetical protein
MHERRALEHASDLARADVEEARRKAVEDGVHAAILFGGERAVARAAR